MKWFDGQIATAIQKSKSEKSLFIVYISGDDDTSKEMDKTWTDPTVLEVSGAEKTLGLKLEAKSEACTQFSQFYPVVCVPSTFFIGANGVPLEVCAGHLTPAQLVEKFKKASEMHKNQLSAQNKNPSTGASSEQPSTSNTDLPGPSQPSLEEKIDKVKLTIAEKREQKSKVEEEKMKEQEKDRRKLGKDMAKLKEWKEDIKRKETVSGWKKDKEEERLARERVKQQIAQDRTERNARFEKEKEERHLNQQAKEAAKAASKAAEESNKQEVKSKQFPVFDLYKDACLCGSSREKARIQFRFPDGSHITNEFSSQETLESVRQFIKPSVKMSNFSLVMTYPRRTFTEEDMQSTLLQLNLAPSAVIIVLPGRGQQLSGGGGGGGGGLSSIIWSLLSPFVLLWGFLSNVLFGRPSTPPHTSGATTPPADSQTQQQAGTSTQQSAQSARPKSSYGLRRRQEGNIHRLTSEDERDDSATWNGNSTQQM